MALSTAEKIRTFFIAFICASLAFVGGSLVVQSFPSHQPTPGAYIACQAIYSYPFGPYGPKVFVSPWHPPYKCIPV